MFTKEPLIVDLAQLEKMSQSISGRPSSARQFAQWNGISLAHCHHSPCEFQEHQLGMSVFYFCRQFKQTEGIAPHQYVTRRRIERAKELLWHSQLPITEIALQVGFATPSAFSRLFRQLTGTTPKAFRQQR